MGKLKEWGNDIKNFGVKNASNAANRTIDAAIEVGKAAMHAAAPDDYEYYLMSLELIDSSYNQKGFISFVVMPDDISENHQPIQSVVKTHKGIVTVFNDSFAPVDISLSGSFGRKFRLIANIKDPGLARQKNLFNLNFGKMLGMGTGVKSGYGLTKVLEHILQNASLTADDGKPYFLIYKNYSLNTMYVVDVVSYSIRQSLGSNMMWNYSIQLRAVAPDLYKSQKRMGEILKVVAANSIANGLGKIVTNMIGF